MFATLAQAAADTDMTGWGKLGVEGVMLALFAYLITKGMPAMFAEYRAENALIRADAEAHRNWAEKRIEALLEKADKSEAMFERCVDKFNQTTLQLAQGTKGNSRGGTT